jgi:hypothetical protein
MPRMYLLQHSLNLFNFVYCLIVTEGSNSDYESLPGLVLTLDKSIRFCGITNKLGYFIANRFREGLKPLMTIEETERYALYATIRHSTRQPWESKIGKVRYTITRYELLTRVTVPLAKGHLLLLSFDVNSKNIDTIMLDNILPALDKLQL